MGKRASLVGLAAGAVAAGAALTGYAFQIAPHWLRVTRLRVALPALPPEWEGLRIAHLSDFHAGGPNVRLSMLGRAKQQALAFRPDLIALTGDFYDNGRLAPTGYLYTHWPAGVPVFAVTGNHDHRGGPARYQALLSELTSAGVEVLQNQAVAREVRGRSAWIVGVDDPHSRRARVVDAFAGVPPDGDVLLYLAHSPSIMESTPVGAARLALTGHTHGGQIRLDPRGKVPFIQQVRRLKHLPDQPDLPIAHGWHWRRGTPVIISDGLGVSTLPARVRTRPQVILIELATASQDGPACDVIERYIIDRSDESRLSRILT